MYSISVRTDILCEWYKCTIQTQPETFTSYKTKIKAEENSLLFNRLPGTPPRYLSYGYASC
jgi:hypothetical protein